MPVDSNQVLHGVGEASNIVLRKLDAWLDAAIAMFPNFIVAVVVLILFFLLSRVIRLALNKALSAWMSNEAVIRLILSLTSVLVMLVGLIIALNILHLEQTVTSILAGVGVIGLALSFAFQDAAANFIAGVSMAFKSPINVGDIIESNDYFGTVTLIGLRATTILTPQGQDIHIPNRLIFQNPYKHYTQHGTRRIDLEVGISYGDDLEKVERITKAAVEGVETMLKERGVTFFYQGFGDSSINFTVAYWVKYKSYMDYLGAMSEGVKRVKKAYDENDITIPFPIRTLDFGIKGGQKLEAMLKDHSGHSPS